MSQTKPTILIVGGAFQTTDFFEPLKSALESHGYPCVLPPLPTCSGGDRTELGKLSPGNDAAAVQKELQTLVTAQSKRVIVLMHSYGGMVGSSMQIKDLTAAARKEKGLEGGLELMVFYASAVLPEGVSFKMAQGGVIPDFDECLYDGSYNFLIAGDTFLDELSPADKEKWSAKVVPHTQKVFDYSIADAAWKYAPCIALLTEKDKALPVGYQEMSAKSVGAKKLIKIPMGHGAHLAQTEELAKAVVDALQSV